MTIYFLIQENSLFLKVHFSDKTKGRVGFSEYHSISHLNYPKVQQVLKDIKRSSVQDRNHFLITNAWFDAYEFQEQVTKENISFRNHSLFYKDELFNFSSTLKLKFSGVIKTDLDNFNKYKNKFDKIRIDCNALYDKDEFSKLFNQLDEEKIEYIEDPFIFHEENFKKIKASIVVDHSYSLDSQNNKFNDFPIIFRPTLTPNKVRAYTSVFSNQFEGILGSWHSYCYYLKWADHKKVHGIFNPFHRELYLNQPSGYLKINKKVIETHYVDLSRWNWKKL